MILTPDDMAMCACRLYSQLADVELDVCVYHAGKDAAARQRIQQDWTSGSTQVVVATVAFGMCALYPGIHPN